MSDLYFVDSNVFVYRHDRDETLKQARAAEVLRLLWQGRCGRLSVQVLNEFYAVATRELAQPVPKEIARKELRQLEFWKPTPLSLAVRERAWSIEDRYGFSWWDSLIVAAALAEGCKYLLTEDLQDGQDLDGLRVVDPFSRSPEEYGLARR